MGTRRTLYPSRNRRKKTTKTSKKKVNNNIKDVIQYEGLPQYGGGTPLTEEQLVSQRKLNAGIQAGAAGLGIVGDMIGNNQVDTTVENTHGNTFEGLMRNSSELDASASKGIDKGNVAGGALSTAGQGASMGAGIGTMIGGPAGTAIGAGVGAVAGGVTGLFTGNKAEKDRIADLKRQSDERVSQAEGVKLNNLNNNLPTYQMAIGGEIPPITPKIGTVPNPFPPPTIDSHLRIIGVKPNWRDLTVTEVKNKAHDELGISSKDFYKNYKKDTDGYIQRLSDKLNYPRDIPNHSKSSKYTKYKPGIIRIPYTRTPSLMENMNYNSKLKYRSPKQMQMYKVPYSKGVYESTLDPEYNKNLYRYMDYQYNKKAYGGKISQQNNNAITQYTGQSHNGPNGGIPVDNNGNPSVLTGNKTVALTENGEVNYKGYIFSNRLKYQ